MVQIQQQIAAKHETDCAQEDARQKQAKVEILTKELNDQERLLQANKQQLEKESSLLEERGVIQLDVDKIRMAIEEENSNLQTLHIQKAQLLKVKTIALNARLLCTISSLQPLQSIDDLNRQHPKEEVEKQQTGEIKVASMSDVAIQCCLKYNISKLTKPRQKLILM